MQKSKPWSVSTTVRNPTRLVDFLRILKETENTQIDYLGDLFHDGF